MNTNSAKIKTVDPKFEMIDPMLAKTRGNTLFQARYGGECLCVSHVYYVHICLYIYICCWCPILLDDLHIRHDMPQLQNKLPEGEYVYPHYAPLLIVKS